MKRRVALVSSCAPPLPGVPATGGGLRTAQLLETLRGAGHSVRLFVEAEALPKTAPKKLREHAFRAQTLAEQVRTFRPSVVVVEQWALVDKLGDLQKPLVIDLHGSLLLENVYRRGDVDLLLDAGTKIQALARADLLLVPCTAQLKYFASWATLAGFDPRELPIAVMPLAMAEAATARKTKRPPLRLVYGGARWPWIDSLDALCAAADAVASIDGARLDVFTYEPPRHGLPFEEDLGTWPEMDKMLASREHEGVYLHRGEGHDQWQAFLLDEATVALDLWRPNPERMLAATTRSIEFLWAGLPVVTVTGASWAEALLASGAGWALAPGNDQAIAELIVRLHSKPSELARASAAATSLIQQQHTLDEAGRSLLDFCAEPKGPSRSEETLVQALVALRETHLGEELRSLKQAHEEEHSALVAAHKREQSEDSKLHKSEVDTLSREHRKQVDALVRRHRDEMQARDGQVTALVKQHRDEMQAERDQRSEEVDRLSQEHRTQVETLVSEHRDEMQTERDRRAQEVDRLSQEHRAQVGALVDEQREESDRRAQEVYRLSQEHQGQTETLVSEHRDEIGSERSARDAEVQRLTSEQRQEVKDLGREHQHQVSALASSHRTEIEALVKQGQQDLEAAAAAAQREAKASTRSHSADMKASAGEHRKQLSAQEKKHRKETEKLVDQWRRRLDKLEAQADKERKAAAKELQKLAADQGAELQRVVDEHRGAVAELAATHQGEIRRQADESSGALAARDQRGREELAKIVAAHRTEVEDLSETHRGQVEKMAAERQDEVQKLVGQGRAELEQADERHRAETQARIGELQEQMSADRRRVKEERTRLEVELRAEMAARELELMTLLEVANRSLGKKLKERLAAPSDWVSTPGRMGPAGRLARLWAEHAVDQPTDGSEE